MMVRGHMTTNQDIVCIPFNNDGLRISRFHSDHGPLLGAVLPCIESAAQIDD